MLNNIISPVTKDGLKIIDFSEGIRDEEIKYNFNAIENQLKRERLYVAGSGIMSGLNFTDRDFNLYMQKGSLIDTNGEEIFFNSSVFEIELPQLILKESELHEIKNGTISLEHVPYSTLRKTPSQYDIPSNWGITVVNADNLSQKIMPLSINGKVLTFSSNVRVRNVFVTYNFALPRYDFVYVDNDYNIEILKGLPSTSPSIPFPKKIKELDAVGNATYKQGYKYALCFIKVNPFYYDSKSDNPNESTPHAKITVQKDFNDLRNIYTDEDNVLWICGQPFKDLQIIHHEAPANPKPNTFWYDAKKNNLNVWRTMVDPNGKYYEDWSLVNSGRCLPVVEYKIWSYEDLDKAHTEGASSGKSYYDLQTFKFDPNEINLKFIPNRNELDIIIDNAPLMRDQFVELIETNPNDPEGNYENLGIGFKLIEPLDHPATVEVKISHRAAYDPSFVRFQRSATFIATDIIEVKTIGADKIINVMTPYKFKENQLEVYYDGVLLNNGIDYEEGIDLETHNKIMGKPSKAFKLYRSLTNVNKVSYKITTNVYSYDHIDDILNGIDKRIEKVEKQSENTIKDVQKFEADVNKRIEIMAKDVSNAVDTVSQYNDFIKKDSVLSMKNMPNEVVKFIPKGMISKTVRYSQAQGGLNIALNRTTDKLYQMFTDKIEPTDFIQVYDISAEGGNRILRRRDRAVYEDTKDLTKSIGYDYDIVIQDGTTYLVLTNNNIVKDGHILHITGLKF